MKNETFANEEEEQIIEDNIKVEEDVKRETQSLRYSMLLKN